VTSGADEQLTIDELARRIGMTVRNIRAHQSRGLLPPPEVRGRTGYYGPEHVSRLELIQELQADGFNLDLIRRLLDGAGGSSREVLRFKHALARPFVTDEAPRPVNLMQLAEEWGTADLSLLQRAIAVGLVRQREDGVFELPSPRLVDHGRELAKLGVPLARSLDVIAGVREHADKIAEVYVQLFLDAIWSPFEKSGQPHERWPEVQEALERLHPLAAESVVAIFGLAMADAVEREFGRTIERIASEHDAEVAGSEAFEPDAADSEAGEASDSGSDAGGPGPGDAEAGEPEAETAPPAARPAT
jgi:DNA-binding transcriptional MerR regulator